MLLFAACLGDYNAGPTQVISLDAGSDPKNLVKLIQAGVAREGNPFTVPPESTVGRWAGDRVALVGDYDDSGLWSRVTVLPQHQRRGGP